MPLVYSGLMQTEKQKIEINLGGIQTLTVDFEQELHLKKVLMKYPALDFRWDQGLNPQSFDREHRTK